MADVGVGVGLGMEVMWREEAGPVVEWIATARIVSSAMSFSVLPGD